MISMLTVSSVPNLPYSSHHILEMTYTKGWKITQDIQKLFKEAGMAVPKRNKGRVIQVQKVIPTILCYFDTEF